MCPRSITPERRANWRAATARYRAKDPEVTRAAGRYSSKKHRKIHAELVRVNNLRYRKRMAEFVRAEKDKPCMDCGAKYPHYVMDFDHVRGVKVDNISAMLVSPKKMAEEIAKCDLVCANCHRARTWLRAHP